MEVVMTIVSSDQCSIPTAFIPEALPSVVDPVGKLAREIFEGIINLPKHFIETSAMAKWRSARDVNIENAFRSCKGVHLPQLHWPSRFPGVIDNIKDEAFKYELINMIWKSQYKILQYLMSHPDHEVFSEGEWHDITQEIFDSSYTSNKYPDKHMVNTKLRPHLLSKRETCKALFPDGLPQKDQWNLKQKQFLAQEGAALVLVLMGKLDRIHAVTDLKTYWQTMSASDRGMAQDDQNLIGPEGSPHFFAAREDEAIKKVQDFLNRFENQGKQVAVIFGVLHDFVKFETCGLKREDEVLPDIPL